MPGCPRSNGIGLGFEQEVTEVTKAMENSEGEHSRDSSASRLWVLRVAMNAGILTISVVDVDGIMIAY